LLERVSVGSTHAVVTAAHASKAEINECVNECCIFAVLLRRLAPSC